MGSSVFDSPAEEKRGARVIVNAEDVKGHNQAKAFAARIRQRLGQTAGEVSLVLDFGNLPDGCSVSNNFISAAIMGLRTSVRSISLEGANELLLEKIGYMNLGELISISARGEESDGLDDTVIVFS